MEQKLPDVSLSGGGESFNICIDGHRVGTVSKFEVGTWALVCFGYDGWDWRFLIKNVPEHDNITDIKYEILKRVYECMQSKEPG